MKARICVNGLPRSGTTWIAKIFDSHPRTLYRHEPDSYGALSRVPYLLSASEAGPYRDVLRSFLDGIPGRSLTKIAGSTPLFPKAYLSPAGFLFRRLLVGSSLVVAKFSGEVSIPGISRVADDPASVLVWKTIESMGRIGAFAEVAPDMYTIQLIRHPCGFIASTLQGERGGKLRGDLSSSEDYEIYEWLLGTPQARRRGLTMDALKAATPIERLAWRWLLLNERAMEEIAGRARCTTVRYEDFCFRPLETARRIFEFVGLDWNGQTEEFIQVSTAADNPAYFSVVKDPVRSASKWVSRLDRPTVDSVRRVVQASAPGELYGDDWPVGAGGASEKSAAASPGLV